MDGNERVGEEKGRAGQGARDVFVERSRPQGRAPNH